MDKFNSWCGAHPFVRHSVPMLEDCRSRSAPLLYAVGPWEITISSVADPLVKRVLLKCTLICCPGPTQRIRLRPAHSQIFSEQILFKKLALLAYEFSRGLGQRVKAFLLLTLIRVALTIIKG
jgi:hypothetical protein